VVLFFLLQACSPADDDPVDAGPAVDVGAPADTPAPDVAKPVDVPAPLDVVDTVEPDTVEDTSEPKDTPPSPDQGVEPEVTNGCIACHTNKALLKELAIEPPKEEEESGGG
jgi:hypothetical protein